MDKIKLTFESVDEYKKYFRKLIELERVAEKEFHLQEIKRLHGQQREKLGRALLHLNAKFINRYLEYNIYRFGRSKMPEHQFSVGDIVLISKGEPLRFNIEGTVSAVGNKFVEVMTTSVLFKSKEYRLDLFVNDVTYKRMLEALENLENSEFDIDILLGKKQPKVLNTEFSHPRLNDSQVTAVSFALSSDLTIVHGPPGTGKTVTLSEIVRAHLGKRLLVTADSNVAVDNLVRNLKDLRIVRLGHPAKIDDDLLKFSLDEQIKTHKLFSRYEKVARKIDALRRMQDERYEKPRPSLRRGLSNEDILELAAKGQGKRGLSAKTLYKMRGWIELQEQIEKLVEKREKILSQIKQEILDEAQVILATNVGAGADVLKDMIFDAVFIDEAAQATEPSALIPMIKAKRAVLAGDHLQLPPVLLSKEAEKYLQLTMFERFVNLYPKSRHLLDLQYRMNEKICGFSSCKFYDCKVKTAPSVQNITLSQLININFLDIMHELSEKYPTRFESLGDLLFRGKELFELFYGSNDAKQLIEVSDQARFESLMSFAAVGGDEPLVFFDTNALGREKKKHGSPSYYNPAEADFVVSLAKKLLSLQLKIEDLGIITPYKDHQEYIKRRVDVEVRSVDGFQGREKEIIILSFVRSNEQGKVGFLNDFRRINVAITRAKRKLIIVGDLQTLKANSLIRELIDYVAHNGLVLKASDLMR